ncbi:MAG: bifunctional 2-C-methyl-D-erythritol 4-phosphate cytidylyltransferase IspD/2-C-methyl-D-erythritol 2,4-cyclodiphosphate synthase IspF, partial [Christensenellaceae bacterium]|nr:bifunctional 2-C-methyl-D-erythritol 4-phosphate cytidylyltransferase IspD/2-C-methyl-D-erythritol 2,4-cyclodiphosphate synthase IspF [Christensenellaceae bacterium]
MGIYPRLVESGHQNGKLTHPGDLTQAQAVLSREETRVGTGYDVHRLAEGRKLILGGVSIPYEKGLVAHSDGDVLVHAIIDALLGAAALPDI